MELSEILQLEENAEAVLIGALESVCPNIYGSRQSDTNESPRISCAVKVGAQFQEQKLTIGVEPFFVYSAYECRAEFVVTTNRTSEETTGAHNTLVGKVAQRLSEYYLNQYQNDQLAVSSAALPCLVTQAKPAECENAEQDMENLDNTTLAITFILVINPAALTTLN
jgi:hypothetical protein